LLFLNPSTLVSKSHDVLVLPPSMYICIVFLSIGLLSTYFGLERRLRWGFTTVLSSEEHTDKQSVKQQQQQQQQQQNLYKKTKFHSTTLVDNYNSIIK